MRRSPRKAAADGSGTPVVNALGCHSLLFVVVVVVVWLVVVVVRSLG